MIYGAVVAAIAQPVRTAFAIVYIEIIVIENRRRRRRCNLLRFLKSGTKVRNLTEFLPSIRPDFFPFASLL